MDPIAALRVLGWGERAEGLLPGQLPPSLGRLSPGCFVEREVPRPGQFFSLFFLPQFWSKEVAHVTSSTEATLWG